MVPKQRVDNLFRQPLAPLRAQQRFGQDIREQPEGDMISTAAPA